MRGPTSRGAAVRGKARRRSGIQRRRLLLPVQLLTLLVTLGLLQPTVLLLQLLFGLFVITCMMWLLAYPTLQGSSPRHLPQPAAAVPARSAASKNLLSAGKACSNCSSSSRRPPVPPLPSPTPLSRTSLPLLPPPPTPSLHRGPCQCGPCATGGCTHFAVSTPAGGGITGSRRATCRRRQTSHWHLWTILTSWAHWSVVFCWQWQR